MSSARRSAVDIAVILAGGVAVFVFAADLVVGLRGSVSSLVIELVVLAGLCAAVAALVLAGLRIRQAGRLHRLAEGKLERLTRIDPLTGLANRAFFEETLARELGQIAANEGRLAAILMLDLKGFKPVDDLFGEAASDELLVQLAARVTPLLPAGSSFARLRGDHFAILLPDTRCRKPAETLACRIMDVLRRPMHAKNAEHLIGVAVGIAVAPADARTVDDLVSRAGHARLRARDLGHWAHAFFAAGMEAELDETMQIERALPAAIGTSLLEPHYQPIFDLRTDKILAFEALARWSHTTLGPVPPDKFVRVAEDVGLIRPLTDHLFQRACKDAADWPDDVMLSFNVSPKELQDSSLGSALLAIAARTGFSPSRLQIEITESAVLRDVQSAREVLATLHAAGVTIALDDFGTGRASLAHLRELKIDALKIDRSFVQSQERDNVMILEAILAIAERLDLSVTAEGIETEAERAQLLMRGCTRGQGYLFAKAMPAGMVGALLAEKREAPPALRTVANGSASCR